MVAFCGLIMNREIEKENIDFTIIIPSRGRILKLKDLLDSIIASCSDISRVEFCIGLDIDDPVLNEYLILLSAYTNIHKTIFVRNHSDNLSDGYYNFMAKTANGRWLWVLNDDCIMFIPGWDNIIRSKVIDAKLVGKIVYIKIGGTGISSADGSYSSFPIQSRESVQTLGYFHYPLIFSWDADEVLWNAYNSVKTVHGHNRMIDCLEVAVAHLNLQNPRSMKPGEGIDDAMNNMIKNYGKGISGKGFTQYPEMINLLLRGISNGL